MARIPHISLDKADPSTAETLRAVKTKVGMIPNLIATFAHAPAALNGYLAFSDALTHGRLNARQREVVALAIGQANACQYCLSAHTAIGKGAGLSPAAIQDARSGRADDALDNAIAVLAVKIVRQRGVLDNGDLATAQHAGVDHALVIEIIANVALNTLTNYTNHVAGTDIDFPEVSV